MNMALYGWLIQGLLIAALLKHISPKTPAWILAATYGLTLIPIPTIHSLAAWLYGAFGLPSVPLTLIALLICCNQRLPKFPPPLLALSILIPALTFYLMALGLGPIDPYRWGYHPLLLLPALSCLSLVLYFYCQKEWLWILTLSVIAYTTGLYPNLWDALFDPLMLIILALTSFKLPAKKKLS